jgi:antitoxin component YwqK of YwqJK toxin-antitoxin module
MIRAKFVCESTAESYGNEQVTLRAVYGNGEANKEWSQWTPNGQCMLTISNPEAKGKFEQGKEYFLDFTPAG